MMARVFILLTAFALDCIIGDPQNPWHPIRFIGSGISKGVAVYKKAKPGSPAGQFVAGAVLTLIIVALSYGLTRLIIWGFYHLHIWAGLVMEAVICYFLIAAKALKDESMKVFRSLAAGDIAEARKNLSYIVGRDTQNLSAPEIVKATVETVAENLSDGVIAPLIFIFIGGAPLGMAYKAVNTLDSMIGYKNEEYEYFGKFAARLDDVVNFIPARISALCMLVGVPFAGGNMKRGWRVYIRDRRNHKSPNASQTESVCAGALGIRLGGGSHYRGIFVPKPTIGDDIHAPEPKHIIAANRLMYAATVIAVIALVLPALGVHLLV